MATPKHPVRTPLTDPNSPQSQKLKTLDAARASAQAQLDSVTSAQDRWHSRSLVWGIAAAALTLGTALTGIVTIVASKEESRNAELAKPLNKTINSTVEAIAGLYREDASAGIEQSSLLASVAEGHTEELRTKNIKLSSDLAQEVANAEKRAEDLRRQNDVVEGNLENERMKRVKLAASFLPRDMFDQSAAIEALSKFPPMEVTFVYGSQPEPEHMARQLAFVFKQLKWPYARLRGHEALIQPGIILETGENRGSEDFTKFGQEKQQGEAVIDALVAALASSKIEATSDKTITGVLEGAEVLIVTIGEKPNREIEEAFRELGPTPSPTPLSATRNRFSGLMEDMPERSLYQRASPIQ